MGKKKRRGIKELKLADDLIIDIISRVSDKDLMRFKCVSESWCSLINTDLYLSQLRSHRTALLGRPLLMIEKIEFPPGGRMLFYNYWLESESIEDGNPNPREIHNSFNDDDARVMGSCEGLLVHERGHKMVVSNPTTQKHHVVPPNPDGDDNVAFIGFGYDHVHACYKLVTEIKHGSNDDRVVELMVYNVNNGTWKKKKYPRFEGLVKDHYFSESGYYSGQCVDGALYWSVYVDMDMETVKIICFVLEEEEFREVDPPRFDEYMDYYVVTVFDGRLCLVCEGPSYDRVEFWLMECDDKRQLGSSYSRPWIKFLSISYPMVMPRFDFSSNYDLIPICFSACKSKVMFVVGDKRLFWYDIGKNEFSELKCRIDISVDGYIHVISCVPSLVGTGIS